MRYLFGFLLAFSLLGCTTTKQSISATGEKKTVISALKFLDEYTLPFNTRFNNTWVGGLSGIDYDQENDQYYIISDDRSATSASRFYKAAIVINNFKIDTIRFLSVHALNNAENDTFPSLQTMPEHAADPESIRFNAVSKSLVWSSEGDKAKRNGNMVYQSPWIFEMDTLGNYKDSFSLPANLHMYKGENGARENDVLEGLSFTTDFKNLWASMEGAIYEDGPLAGVDYANAPSRFTKFNLETKQPVAQYAYLLDAIAKAPVPANAFAVNGISENLYIGDNKFLVLERSFSTGNEGCTIKVFLADLSNATNVIDVKSLYNNKEYIAATKKLLFNFDTLNRYIDNVEGITFGPLLPNGHQSLIFIVDNNFNPMEKSQIFLFEIIP